MNFEPVDLPADLHPTSLSVTLLSKANSCPRSAHLSLSSSGGAGSHEMIRGTAVHTAIERCIQDMMLTGNRKCPGELAREIATEVISEGVLLGRETDPHPGRVPVPFSEHDFIRLCLFRWSEFFELDPHGVRGLEQMFEWEVAGWTIRGKLDLAVREGGGVLHIFDWKSSRAMPSHDEVSVQRADGRLMPKTFALILYALLARYGNPVEWMVCGACEGPVTDPHAMSCEACEGKGGAWRRLSQWPTFDAYHLSLVYPAIDIDDGLAERGPMVLEERDLHDFRRALTGHVELFDSRLESGDFPAVPGSHCSECPAPAECPLPAHLRDFEGAFETLELAEAAAEALYVSKKQAARVQTALRNAAKSNGWEFVRCGSDRAFSFSPKSSHETDWDRLEADRRAGNVRDLSEYRTRKESTEFKDRKWSA